MTIPNGRARARFTLTGCGRLVILHGLMTRVEPRVGPSSCEPVPRVMLQSTAITLPITYIGNFISAFDQPC